MSNIDNFLKQRLQEPLPGLAAQMLMVGRVRTMPATIPANARQSAVLCLLYYHANAPHVLLIEREADRSAHSKQIAFPGGRFEEEDGHLQHTAQREAHEEVGLHPSQYDILGPLTPLYIPVSNFNVAPYVAFSQQRPQLVANSDEVARLIEVPLPHLFAKERKVRTDVITPALNEPLRQVHAYALDEQTLIWGATAMILSELEQLVLPILP